jgi:type III pantothenate kinase
LSTLLVDIGNTRVKWALLRGGTPSRVQALAHEGDADAAATPVRRSPRGVDRIIAVNVAGAGFERALSRAARERFGITPEFFRSTRTRGGVVNGYREVWRLGADRWMGVIGAHRLVGGGARGRDALVVIVGTALTVDLVTRAGRHRGGAIVPGPATMVASLLAGTNGIRRRARGIRPSARRLFAADTASALAGGARFAATAFIDRAVAEATRLLGAPPALILSGGGAPELRPLLAHRARIVPDLVLRGLAACAADR